MPSSEATAPSQNSASQSTSKKKSRSPSSSSKSSSSTSRSRSSNTSRRKQKKDQSSDSDSDVKTRREKVDVKKKSRGSRKKKRKDSSSSGSESSSDSSSSNSNSNSNSSDSDHSPAPKKKAADKSTSKKKSKSPNGRKKSKSPTKQKPTTKTKEDNSRTKSPNQRKITSPSKTTNPAANSSPSPSPPPPPPPSASSQQESHTSKKETIGQNEAPKDKTNSPPNKKAKHEDTKKISNKESRSSPALSKPNERQKSSSRSPSSEERSHLLTQKRKSPDRKRRSRSRSSSDSGGHVRARQKSGGGGITIGRKTGLLTRQPKGVRVSKSPSPTRSSASGKLESIAASETNKEKGGSGSSSSTASKKFVVDKSDTSLFKEGSSSSSSSSGISNSQSNGGNKTESKRENGKSRFSPLVSSSSDTKAVTETVKGRKPSARPPSKSLTRPNPESPLTVPQWCDLVSWHNNRDVHFEMTRRSEKLGNVNLQKRRCYVIGRTAPLCDIAIDHPSLSRRHAVIMHHRESGCVYIMDLKSTQGTWLNRRKLIPHLPTALTEKCTLSFGTSTRTYHLRGLVPQNTDLSKETLEFLSSRNTLENTVIEGIQMGSDGPLPFHSITVDDKQLIHDEPLPEESARLSLSKPSSASTPAAPTTGRFEDMEPDTAFVPLAEPTGTAEEEKLKSLTPAARLIFLRKQEEERAAAARTQALKAMSAGKTLVIGRAAHFVPVAGKASENTSDGPKKENLGLYDVMSLPNKRALLDAKQQQILLNGAKIPSISRSFCSSSSSSKQS